MSRQNHLGIICVDVSELLKAHQRRKVERRDNMLLYKGSYLITNPVPSATPPPSSVGRTPSNSPPRGTSVSSSVRRKSRSPRRRRCSGSRRRRHRRTPSPGKEDHHPDDASGAKAKAMPPIPGALPAQGRAGELTVSAGYSSEVGVWRPKLHFQVPPDESQSAGSSFAPWRSAQQQLPLMGGPDFETLVPFSPTPAASSQDASRPKQHDPREYDSQPLLSSPLSRQKEVENARPREWASALSDSASRGLDRVMESLQRRVWEKSPVSYQPSLSINRSSDRHSADRRGDPEGGTEIDSLSGLGPPGVMGGNPGQKTWGSPRPLHKRPTVRHVKPDAELVTRSCLLRDSRGTERVMLLGVVPTLPKPVVQFPPAARGRAAVPTLPPAFRRAARAMVTPTKRPKRF
ncbi:uncharacterized protein Tco025E_07956 [Trypanosoma conorhini]|uniref:Uncharacterized protein n=1 Tax=Trypanosoma conorhini TaxID=83891 RepID=A0A422NFZ7_9TRYP|nr:uncharacterized protein Tco025E_07956 [Trypanosoma conorhini]RNF04391.1 hypothetical protein Tco025E_07956 [Trypanosoma conorhini]